MGYPTPIEWTDATWNPVGGCSIASPGCGPCYAMKLAGTRLKNHPLYAGTTDVVKGRPIFNGTMTAAPDDADVWTWPLRWRGVPEGEPRVLGLGMPSTIFVVDMGDVFHENRELEAIDRVMATIARAPQHIFQLLTKRPDIMVAYCASIMPRLKILGGNRTEEFVKAWFAIGEHIGKKQSGFVFVKVPPDNIWFGTSAERQQEFDARWPHLRRLAEMGFTVFISYEPAMGPLVLPPDFLALGRRAQVIAGGASGDRAWPAHPDWFRRVRDQCVEAGVAFFFKQWGEWLAGESNHGQFDPRPMHAYRRCDNHSYEWPRDNGADNFGTHPDKWSGPIGARRVGKKAAGRLLDGMIWNEFPAVQQTLGATA